MVALGTAPDLLRLLVVPGFAWAAYRDVRTRRVPNRLWPPLVAIGVIALVWEVWNTLPLAGLDGRLLLIRVGFAIGFLVPFAFLAYRMGAFGGADAKALMTLAVCFPTYPIYFLPSVALPLVPTTLRVMAMTALTNAVLIGMGAIVWLGTRNALAGRISNAMLVGRRVSVDQLPETHGSLLLTEGVFPSRGLDLDALRMYLRWRGSTLADLRTAPSEHRDPQSVTETHPSTDGAVTSPRGSSAITQPPEGNTTGFPQEDTNGATVDDPEDASASDQHDDPWAAARFLREIEGSAYGTSPRTLRDGLERITRSDEVWISPGLPFLVPLFLGILVGLTYGDILFALLSAAGLV